MRQMNTPKEERLIKALEIALLFITHRPDCQWVRCIPPAPPECDCGAFAVMVAIQEAITDGKYQEIP